MTSTNRDFSNQNIKILSIDFETMQITENNIARNQIFAAGFYSNTGFKEAIHLEDVDINNNEVKFIRHIVYRIQSFPGIITGWYLANSDLVVLDEVCKHIGVRSPVEFYEVLVTPAEDDDFGNTNSDDNDNHASITIEPQVIRYPYLRDKKIIDMYKVFHHGFIKNSVYPFKYRDLHLDTVGTAMLGHGKYVSESTGVKITGENVLQYPVFEQKKYVLRDAELVIRLIERNNYEILNVLRCIAEIAGLDFRQVCHAGVGKAWEAIIYRMIETGQCKRPATEGLKKRRYSGALVLEPEPKSYDTPIDIFDAKGLYPTVMILHNISFETVCCECCKDNPDARVRQSIMDGINEDLKNKVKSKVVFDKEKRLERYWICAKHNGAIPSMLLKFKEEREDYRSKGNETMSEALKVMMNSIYGLFGSDGVFAFQDYRIAELVTAFARLKLLEMKELASKDFGMSIIYGDTDSIFVADLNGEQDPNSIASFIAGCKQNLGVDVDHQNSFVRSILVSKKHYIGIQPDGKVIIKGMEGKKRDRPPFFNQVFMLLIEDYKNNKGDLSLNVIEAFQELESAEVAPSLLAYSVILSKDAGEYQPYTPQYKIGGSLKKESGSLIKYYKTGEQEDGYKGYSTNYQDLNIDVYKLELWKIVKDILRLLGYDIQKLEEQIFSLGMLNRDDMIACKNNLTFVGRRGRKHRCTETNVHSRNESLTNYCILLQHWRGIAN